jgi:Fur family ferric uptake transcriptional regulator
MIPKSSNLATPPSGAVPQAAREAAVERFRAFLRASSLKYTHEREQVLREFFAVDHHFEAEELLTRLRTERSRVSRATIYRTLDLLVQAGLARKVRLGTDHYYFEHVLGRRQHEHMICLGCDRVIEWYDEELEAVLQRNLQQQGFVASRYNVQVFGHCADCQAD